MRQADRTGPFERALVPGHICSINESESEHLALLVAFVRVGLERREKCVYITDEADQAGLREAFRDGGIDVGAAAASHALVLVTTRQTFLKGDYFDPDRMLAYWKEAAIQAHQEGFTALRAGGDMQWLLRGDPGSRRWREYEWPLTNLAADVNCLLLCEYRRPPFPAETVLNAVRAHPSVIHRGTFARNIYHVSQAPPAQAAFDESALESLLVDILKREQVESIHGRREEERRRNERRLNVALASSNVAFTILRAVRDETARIIDFSWQYANPEASRVMGKGVEDLIGHRIAEALPRAWDPPGLFEHFVRVAETGEPGMIEVAFTQDGVTRWWQNVVAKFEDGLAVWFPEITERKRQEEGLRRSEAYLADGQRLGHTGSWAWDVLSQEISFWSLEHFRIVGFDPGVKPSYALFRPLVHPDDLAFIEQNFARAVHEQVDFDHEYRIIRPDGMLRNMHTFGHPVFDEGGTLIEYAGTIIDSTERKQAEAALRATQSELARVSRLTTLGELTASIAHEVNQPLAGVMALGDAARRWLGGPSPNLVEARMALDGVAENARRASEVIARIRALARRADSKRELLDLNQVIREAIELAQGEVHENNAALRAELGDSLPAAFGDRVQLQQVVLNLVMNAAEAISACREGPREILVRTWESSRKELHASVRDSGIGLSPENLQRIFEPFYTTKSHGTGIGLSISRSIIEAHDGRLWGERNENTHGLTMHFILPVPEVAAGVGHLYRM